MGLGLYKKKSFKIFLISGILIILGVFVIFNYSQILKWWEVNVEGVKASIDAKIRGWAWGENMGWISMNCYNDFDFDYIFENCCPGGDAENCTSAKICQGGSNEGQACSVDGDCPGSTCSGLAGGDYGVYYDTSSQRLRGYAWSDKVGWICFGKSCKCADCTNCPDYNTCYDPDHECSDCPNNVKPPHGRPFPWACVGRPTWICDNDLDQTCINDDGCLNDGTCIFSCSGDGDYDPSIAGTDEEDFLDISAPNAPCYSTNRATLRAHWKMNAPEGDIADALEGSSGYGNTLSGSNLPILANGKINDALQFDGNDYVQALDSASISLTKVCLGGSENNASCDSDDDCLGDGTCTDNNLNLTAEAWIKRGAIDSEQTIIGKWDEAVEGKSYRLWFDINNKLNFSVADNSNEATITQLEGICFGYEDDGSDSCSSDADCAEHGDGVFCRNPFIIDTRKWHHVAGKYIAEIGTNAASLRLFIDGLKVNTEFSGTTPVSLSDKENKLYIGAKKGTSAMDTYFNGIIDNVSIWSCGSAGFLSGRSGKDIWNDAKIEVSGWAKVVALGDGGWLKLQGFTKAGKVWGLYLDDYDTFYTIGGYMANRYADTSMDTTGLVANWLMDEPSWANSAGGSIPVADSSPLANNPGIANGAIPNTEGIFNSAGEFDGENDYIGVSDNDSLDFTAEDNFTIQFWAKPNSFPTNGSIPIVKRGTGVGYEIGITPNGTISWKISDEQENIDSTDSLTLNAWNHIAIVFDRGNGITRYLNGGTAGGVGDFGGLGDLSNDLSLYIGGKSDIYSFSGLIDNVSVYNIARTGMQILADYNKQNPYCAGWEDYDHDYGDPPAPFDFEITEINNTEAGCYQLFVHWDQSTWAESYTYERCDGVLEAQCLTCPGGYTERNILSGACDEYGQCSLQDAGLSENTGYCYKIQAHNETGSTYNSNDPIPVWKSTTLCAPETPTIDDDTCGEIKLTWGWDSEGSVDGYNIYNSLSTSANFGIISHLGEAMDYTGLMAQWKMNETSWDGSNKEVRDSSNQTPANHGTAQNLLTTISDGKFSYAGNFDGINDYIDCGSSNNLEVSTATIQAWIKRGSTNTRDVIITDSESSALDEDHFLRFEIVEDGVGVNDDKLAIIFGDNTDGVTKYSTGTINDTDWHHVAVVRDDTAETITFYIDGEAENEQTYYNELNTICSGGDNPGALCDSDVDCIGGGTCVGVIIALGNDDIWIGKSNVTGFESPFHGLIDNLAIYNVARTAEQIKLDYESGNCGSDDCSLSGECHLQGLDTNCGYALGDDSNCANCPNYVCHVQGNPDGNCGTTVAGDDSVCCYTDKRILPYVNYYYKTTATSEAGESPFSNCNWGELSQPDCPVGFIGSCCPWGNTICFPPVETEEE